MTPEIETLRKWVEESGSIVFFGGAGVSTESGIPDFRGTGGLYHQQYAYPPETILSHTFFERNPEEFFRFYRDKMLFLDAQPNAAHRKLAEWEEQGKLQAVITQNIDGLHQKAGSRRVLELHGSVLRNHCQTCGTFSVWRPLRIASASPGAAAAGSSSPTWSSMRRGWTRRSSWRRCPLSAMRRSSSSAAPP